MESEYIGASETSRHIMWLRGAMKNLGLGNETPTELGIDNKSAKMFAEEHMIQNRSKHIDTKYHYVQEKIAEGEIKLFYQPTLHNPADIFTKPLSGVSFNRFRKMMGVVNVRRWRDTIETIRREWWNHGDSWKIHEDLKADDGLTDQVTKLIGTGEPLRAEAAHRRLSHSKNS